MYTGNYQNKLNTNQLSLSQNKNYDDLSLLSKLLSNYNFEDINKQFSNINKIESTKTYEYLYKSL